MTRFAQAETRVFVAKNNQDCFIADIDQSFAFREATGKSEFDVIRHLEYSALRHFSDSIWKRVCLLMIYSDVPGNRTSYSKAKLY